MSNDADFDDKNVNKRMQFLRAKLEHVWNRWSKEYLVGLREYHRTTKDGEALTELGTLVLTLFYPGKFFGVFARGRAIMALLFISVSVTPMLLELSRMVPTAIKKPIRQFRS